MNVDKEQKKSVVEKFTTGEDISIDEAYWRFKGYVSCYNNIS